MSEYGNLPFDEAEQFFRDKIRIPTQRWDDLKRGEHAKGFMIAGAMRDDMLCDFQQGLRRAIEEGTTLEAFRKDFDAIVAKYGWSYNGGRGWRTRVIYDTNLRTSYMAGRYAQMTDPDVLAYRPFWRYRHGDSRRPRPQHLAWNGMVFKHDDPFWSTHYPPNGWGCKCSVEPLSQRDLTRSGKVGPDQAPPVQIDAKTGAPVGIDQGWDYNVGEAAYGKRLSAKVMDEWRDAKGQAWERITPGDWKTHGLGERIPGAASRVEPMPVITDAKDAVSAMRSLIGGDEAIYTAPSGQRVLVNAEALVAHIADHLEERTPYLHLVQGAIEDPDEIWIAFERHKGTGKVELRQRFLKMVRTNKDRGLFLITQVNKGYLEAWTMFVNSNWKYQNKQRAGRLIWAKDA